MLTCCGVPRKFFSYCRLRVLSRPLKEICSSGTRRKARLWVARAGKECNLQFGRLFKLSEWAIVLAACGNQAEARRTCEISSDRTPVSCPFKSRTWRGKERERERVQPFANKHWQPNNDTRHQDGLRREQVGKSTKKTLSKKKQLWRTDLVRIASGAIVHRFVLTSD